MKPAYDTQTMSASIAKDQTFQIDAADIIVLQGKSALDDTFDVSEDGGVTWRSVSVRESVIFTSGQPVHVRAVDSNMVVEIERKTLSHFLGDEGERLPIVTATTGPGGGNRLSAGGQRLHTLNPRWWQHAQPQAIRRPLMTPGIDTMTLVGPSGGASVLADALDTRFSSKAIEFTTPDGGGASKIAYAQATVDVNLTLDDVIVLYFFIPEDIGGLFSMSAWLYETGTTNGIASTYETSTTVQYAGAGVVACARRLSEFTGAGPKPADASTYQNYKTLRVLHSAAAGSSAGRSQFLHAEVVRRRTPMVCITADDGWLGVRDVGAPAFNSYGVPMTLFLHTALISGDNANYMRWTDIARLAHKGNVMGNHTHSNKQAGTATVDEWAADVLVCADELTMRGYADGAMHLAWVQGVHSKPYDDRAREIGLLSARGVVSRGIYGSYGIPSPYAYSGISSTDRTAAQMLADIGLEVGRGADCTVVMHDFSEATNAGLICSRAEATALAKGLRERAEAGTIIVGTVPELWARRQAEAGWSPEV